jgi:fucose permease
MVAETAAESAEIGPARARPPTKLFRSWKPQLEREQIQRFSACCLAYVLLGWFDGANGALLPYIQEHYDIGYNVVALLFIANFVGAITTTGLNVWITTRLGMGKVS